MGFLDKAKSAAEQAAKKAKDTADDVQTKRGLGQAYGDLGRATYELIESGEIAHVALVPLADKIRELAAKGDDEAEAEVEAEEPAGTAA